MSRNASKTPQTKGLKELKQKTVMTTKTDPISLIKIRTYVTKQI